ncbi:hypothetical protein [Nocardiopsis potens]|uniref:hypothetical protein n=1 Tax=Nocardiopsis potens TaxID=1246458 RepID=UPI000349E6D5|nr:hypothetical protein [Nocardiopsis potens]
MTNPLVSLRTKTSDFIAKRRENKKDRGATFIEYGALVLLVAAVVAAVFGFGLKDKVVAMFDSGFQKISESTDVDFEGGDQNPDDQGDQGDQEPQPE